MRWRKSMLVPFLFLGVICAQTAPQVDSQAVTVIAQSMSAMGATEPSPGNMRLSSGTAIQDSVATGTILFADSRTGTVRIETKGPDRVRYDTSINGVQITTVFNSGRGYVLQGGVKHKFPIWISQYHRAEHIPVLSRLADYSQPNSKLKYVGLAAVPGSALHHVRISSLPTDATPADVEDKISEFHVFVDPTSMLVVKSIGFAFSPGIIENRTLLETYYSDYRPVGGLLVPYHLIRYAAGQKFCEITFTSVTVNAGVPDSDFQ